MRAVDFLVERDIKVEIPIKITIPQDGGDPKISVADQDTETDDSASDKVMVSPLQQEIEMAKAAQGKESPVIDKLIESPSASLTSIIPISSCLSSTVYSVEPNMGGFSGMSIMLTVMS